MVYKSSQKEYFIYKEYDDEFGFKERIYITSGFETIGHLFEYMNLRKQHWHGNTRKVEIEIIHGLDYIDDSDKDKKIKKINK